MAKMCPNGHEVNDNVRFCPICGAEVSSGGSRFCKKCGNERLGTENFCSKCGTPFEGASTLRTNNITYNGNETNNSSKMKIILPIVIGVVLLALIGGGWYYWNLTQKANSLLTIETVIDLYKNTNKEHIRQVLKDNGYSLFKSEDESEYWTKNVQLKAVTTYNGDTVYEPIEKKGGSVSIYGNEYISISVSVYADEDFKEWEKQLQKLGYKEEKYGDDLPEEDGWTALGAHGNLCRLYKDSKGNSVEFMKDGDGHPGYDVYDVSTNESE